MKVKIKKLSENAVIPSYAKDGDAGMDLTAVSKAYDKNGNVVFGTGLAFEIPKGYVGLLFPRSSSSKTSMRLSNSVGVLDSGYRGEVMFKFKPDSTFYNPLKLWWYRFVMNKKPKGLSLHYDEMTEFSYNVGDRIGQIVIMPYPTIEFEESEELSETERGNGGFGSTNEIPKPKKKKKSKTNE